MRSSFPPGHFFLFLYIMKLPKASVIIYSLALAKLVIHLLTMHIYGLHRDAFLYYTLGEHLDWGYVSVPPFIGLLSRFSTIVFGNTVFALRIFPALIGSFSVIIIGKLVRELKGGNLAVLIACLAFVLSPSFLGSNSLFQPTSFNQFFWLLSGYFLVRMVNKGDPRAWFPVMITWGIAFQNKYSISFVILATLAGLLLTPQRKLLWSKYFVLAGITGILIILPNVIWQYNHNWPVVHHLSELQRTQFVNVTIKGILVDQLVNNLPAIFVWIPGLVLFLSRKEVKAYRFLPYMYFFTLLIIILLRGKGYYTLGLYSILFAMGGVALERFYRKPLRFVALGWMVASFGFLLPLGLPLLSYEKLEKYSKPIAPLVNRWEDGEVYSIKQDFADMTGWEELGNIVVQQYLSLDEGTRKEVMIYGENYGHAGSINFYGKKHGLPGTISFNDNFIMWAPDSIENAPMIYVNHEIGDLDMLYDKVELVGRVNNHYFRENGLRIYYCSQPTDILRPFYSNKVAEIKAQYQRK